MAAVDPADRAPRDRVFSLSPAVVTSEVDAGSTLELRAVASNQTLEALQVDTGAQDVEASRTAPDGKQLVPAGEASRGAASWITIEPASFRLGSGEEQNVRIIVRVPSGTAPGGHFATVQAAASPVVARGNLDLRPVLNTLVLLTVRGKVRHDVRATIEPRGRRILFAPPSSWRATVENKGNVHELVGARVEVDGLINGTSRSAIRSHILLPGARRTFAVAMPHRSAPDLLRGRLQYAHARDGEVDLRSDSVRAVAAPSVLILPWWMIVAIVLASGIVLWRVRKRSTKRPPGDDDPSTGSWRD